MIVERAQKSLGSIDLLSLDVDGIDYWLLLELDELDCSVIVLEYNSIFGPESSVTVPYKEDFQRTDEHFSNQFYGASLRCYINLLAQRKYSFIGTNRANTNAFFVKDNLKIEFDHLTTREIKEYTNANIRESRDREGSLSYFSQSEGLADLLDFTVVDTESKSFKLLRDLSGLQTT
jgi:hypothetical protein